MCVCYTSPILLAKYESHRSEKNLGVRVSQKGALGWNCLFQVLIKRGLGYTGQMNDLK